MTYLVSKDKFINIAHREDSNLDVKMKFIEKDVVHFQIRLNEDGAGETEIDYYFTQEEVHTLIEYLDGALAHEA
jgi:hypothetical protein|tara:strand:- start:3219 stop:3440 length:222 start_codon:yes stop_codon:yes gene_type:complete